MALDLNLFTSPFVAAYRKRAVTSHSCERNIPSALWEIFPALIHLGLVRKP